MKYFFYGTFNRFCFFSFSSLFFQYIFAFFIIVVFLVYLVCKARFLIFFLCVRYFQLCLRIENPTGGEKNEKRNVIFELWIHSLIYIYCSCHRQDLFYIITVFVFSFNLVVKCYRIVGACWWWWLSSREWDNVYSWFTQTYTHR